MLNVDITILWAGDLDEGEEGQLRVPISSFSASQLSMMRMSF